MPDTSYTTEVAAEICRRMGDGESLRAICRSPGMPARVNCQNVVPRRPQRVRIAVPAGSVDADRRLGRRSRGDGLPR